MDTPNEGPQPVIEGASSWAPDSSAAHALIGADLVRTVLGLGSADGFADWSKEVPDPLETMTDLVALISVAEAIKLVLEIEVLLQRQAALGGADATTAEG